MNWLCPAPDGCVLTVKATPRAKRSEIVGADPEWLRVRLQAPPVDGKANEELIALFSKRFRVPKNAVEILAGDVSRHKRVKLRGVAPAAVLADIGRQSTPS